MLSFLAIRLELVSPVEEHIDPVATRAVAATAALDLGRRTNAEIMRFLVQPVAQIRRVVPQHAAADTHARRDEIPKVPLSQDHARAMEIAAVESPRTCDARAAVATYRHIHSFEVGAD